MQCIKNDIKLLREQWATSGAQGLSAEMQAYCRLLAHPDATWQDLLSGLDRPDIIAEQAWLKLRMEFKELEPMNSARRDRTFWRLLLDEKQLSRDVPYKMGVARLMQT